MRTIIAVAIFVLIFAAFCSPLAAQITPPTFLFSLESKGVPSGTIHVYSVNAATGAITEVPGSPFSAGLVPEQLVVDPTGRFVYVTNEQSQDITAFSVDPSTGALTELAGSPYSIGTPPNLSTPVASAIDPTGRFLYVFATSIVSGSTEEFLYEYTIDGVTGVLNAASLTPAAWEFRLGILINSIVFNPAGSYAYLGQVVGGNSGEPTLVCSVDFNSGTLTPVGAVQPATTGEASQIAVSPGGNFLYSIDSPANQADAFAISSGGESLSEISGSPYAVPANPFSLAVHPSGNFLYIVNENQFFQPNLNPSQYDGSISAFAINPANGALTQIPGSPFAAGINPTSIVVDPTGRFAYSTSTTYASATAGFAQVQGFSIASSTGALTPLSWSPWTDTAESFAGGLAVSRSPLTSLNPVPMISSLSPSSAIANDTAFTLQVNGVNFVTGSTVFFGGQARSTTFVSSTLLNAGIFAADVDNDGTAVVFVFNPLPGGGTSTSLEFPVAALSPTISAINPSSIAAAALPFALSVSGANFVASSVVNFNGTPQAPSFDGPSLITTEITTAQIASQGTASITVTTPTNGVPGGGTSNAVTLTITAPNVLPAITSISPSSATAGGPAFTLSVSGSGFVQGSQVSFNLQNVSTTLVNSTQLTALISASAIAIAGNPYVIVTNPDGFASAQVTLRVNNPLPGGGAISPPGLPAGSNDLTLKITGTGFVLGSVVLVNGTRRVTTFESSTLLLAMLQPSDIAQGGALTITVMNPPPGGGTTAAISFIVSDFKVTSPSSTPSITAGQTATFALTVSSIDGTFSSQVTFGVSQSPPLPAGTTPTFAPSAPITPGATPQPVTLSVATTPHTVSSAIIFPRELSPVLQLLIMVSVGLALLRLWFRARGGRLQRLAPQIILALLIIAAAGLIACGAVGTGPSTPPQVNPSTGTPAGTYPIIVTATSGGVSHSATVTLTVM
ncbi:MAG TPA: beta-propeller fold lactonase family protein [Candidatus Acidoferrum sp.]|nr:beta-propeller fold lactonase family protein [Candidatus Acidoferrum sp.]